MPARLQQSSKHAERSCCLLSQTESTRIGRHARALAGSDLSVLLLQHVLQPRTCVVIGCEQLQAAAKGQPSLTPAVCACVCRHRQQLQPHITSQVLSTPLVSSGSSLRQPAGTHGGVCKHHKLKLDSVCASLPKQTSDKHAHSQLVKTQ
jgi:hypothetical protein